MDNPSTSQPKEKAKTSKKDKRVSNSKNDKYYDSPKHKHKKRKEKRERRKRERVFVKNVAKLVIRLANVGPKRA